MTQTGPDASVTRGLDLLEVQGRVTGVNLEDFKVSPREALHLAGKGVEALPEP